jgi:predicted N-acyltransferase
MPNTKLGPQNEDLDGEQMRAPGEGEVMDAQFDKKNAGWGEQGSFTSDLDRQKAEQKGAREEVKAARQGGANVDGGVGNRVENEGLGSV